MLNVLIINLLALKLKWIAPAIAALLASLNLAVTGKNQRNYVYNFGQANT